MLSLIKILELLGSVTAFLVIGVKNPVHSVFFLILTFCISSCILLTLLVDFLAIIFVVVYVGAIAVLFLFVVMMLNIKFVEFTESIVRFVPFSLLLGFIFLNEIIYLTLDIKRVLNEDWICYLYATDSILLLSEILYTNYIYIFFLAGIILLLAMLGSINITLYHATNVKRQQLYKQLGRNLVESVYLIN